MYKSQFFFLSLSILFSFAGCGGTTVSGVVKYSDGTPLHLGTVMAESDKDSLYGAIDKDGHFVLGKLKPGDSVPVGTYTVWITDTTELTAVREERIVDGHDASSETRTSTQHIAAKYRSKGDSPLTLEIKPGKQTHNITVEKP